MDKNINDILRDAAEEAYEDDFATDNDASDYRLSSASPDPDPSRNSPVQSITASLQSAARALDAEEAQEARERLVDSAAEVRRTVEQVAEPHRPAEPKPQNPRARIVQAENSDDNIGAALERADDAIAQKYSEAPASPSSPAASDSDDEPDSYDTNQEIISLCYHNRIDELTRQLRKGASILCVDHHGWTPLHWAAAHNKTDMLEYLLHDTPAGNTKGYVNHREKLAGYTPLHVSNYCVLFDSY